MNTVRNLYHLNAWEMTSRKGASLVTATGMHALDELLPGFGQDEPSSEQYFFKPNRREFLHARYRLESGAYFRDSDQATLNGDEYGEIHRRAAPLRRRPALRGLQSHGCTSMRYGVEEV